MRSHGHADQVWPLTVAEIENKAAVARIQLLPEYGTQSIISHKVDVDYLLQVTLPRKLGIQLHLCEDADLPGSFAEFDADSEVLSITSSIMVRARQFWGEALFTIYHEIAHVILHRKQVFARRSATKSIVGQIRSIEDQADYGAMALAIGNEAALKIGCATMIARISQMPLEKCTAYLAQLKKGCENKKGARLPSSANMEFDFD